MTTIDQYRRMLPVAKHRLDEELEIQADIMDRIATQVVIANSRSLQAKEDLAKLEGSLLEDFKDGEAKLSVALIDAKIRRDPSRIKAWRLYQEARAEHESWQGLLEAWRLKGYNIKTLADLYAAQYFTVDSHHLSQRQRDRLAEGDNNRAEARKRHGDRDIDVTKEGILDEPATTKSSRRSLA